MSAQLSISPVLPLSFHLLLVLPLLAPLFFLFSQCTVGVQHQLESLLGFEEGIVAHSLRNYSWHTCLD
jgi:hypothetical protein